MTGTLDLGEDIGGRDLSELRPLRVAVDAGKRHGGPPRPWCSGRIPGITVLPLYFELDGTFPNHEANPLDPANLVDLQAHVLATGADIGLAFDGDADRYFVGRRVGSARTTPSAVTALVAGPRTGPRDRCHRDPQPDHLPGGAGTDRRAGRHRGALAGRVTSTSRG